MWGNDLNETEFSKQKNKEERVKNHQKNYFFNKSQKQCFDTNFQNFRMDIQILNKIMK